MSTHNSQVLDSHESSPALHTPEDSGSDDTSTSPPRCTVPKTLCEFQVRNIQLNDKYTELRCQNAELKNKNDKLQEQNTQLQDGNVELRIHNAELQAEVEKDVAIAQMRERLVQPVKQDKEECEWHFLILWMIIALVLFKL